MQAIQPSRSQHTSWGGSCRSQGRGGTSGHNPRRVRKRLSLGLLQLKLPLCGAGGDEVAQHVVVARQIPLLHVLKPRHDVVAVAYQVRVVGSAQRRRQEGDRDILSRYNMNGRFQMLGDKNWILSKDVNANRFFWDSRWLEIWSNHLCSSMGPNGGRGLGVLDGVQWLENHLAHLCGHHAAGKRPL